MNSESIKDIIESISDPPENIEKKLGITARKRMNTREFRRQFGREPLKTGFSPWLPQFSALKSRYRYLFSEVLDGYRDQLTSDENRVIFGIKKSLSALNELRLCLRSTKMDSVPDSQMFEERSYPDPCFWESEMFRISVSSGMKLFNQNSIPSNQILNEARNYSDCIEEQLWLSDSSDSAVQKLANFESCSDLRKLALEPVLQSPLDVAKYAMAIYRDYNWRDYHQEFLPCLSLRSEIEQNLMKNGAASVQQQDRLFDCQVRQVCAKELASFHSCTSDSDDSKDCEQQLRNLFACGIDQILISDLHSIQKIIKIL